MVMCGFKFSVHTGAEIVREPSSAKDQLNSAIALLPFSVSSADQITEQLLAFGARYHRYLHQDKFGPKRAEQLAALRDIAQKLDLIIAQLAQLPDQAHEALFNCLASGRARDLNSHNARLWNVRAPDDQSR